MSLKNRVMALSMLFGATQLSGCATSLYGDKGQELTIAFGNPEGAENIIATDHRVVRIPSYDNDAFSIYGGKVKQDTDVGISTKASIAIEGEQAQAQGVGRSPEVEADNLYHAGAADADTNRILIANTYVNIDLAPDYGELACKETLLKFNEITNTLSGVAHLVDDADCADMKYYKNPQGYNFEFGGITGCFASKKVSPERLKASPNGQVVVALDSVPVALCYEYVR